jgi:hypothetical protein
MKNPNAFIGRAAAALLVLVVVVTLLTGCSPSPYTDPATGCEYLTKIGTNADIAPRIAVDGRTHRGCRGR